MRGIDDILAAASVIPVLVLDDLVHAAPLAKALWAGGLRVAELTLRTPAALDGVAVMKAAAPDLIIGMGTVLDAAQAASAHAAGADFLVSPGATPALLAAFRAVGLPTLPGVATLSEAMAARAPGCRRRSGLSVRDRWAAAGSGVLPHRGHRARAGRGLFAAFQCRVRRRQLDRAG
jgi:Entner-Doudoroff aldolase